METTCRLPDEKAVHILQQIKERDGAAALAAAYRTMVNTPDELILIRNEPAREDPEPNYFDVPLLSSVCARFPWLLSLMLVQSVSGFVLQGFEVTPPLLSNPRLFYLSFRPQHLPISFSLP